MHTITSFNDGAKIQRLFDIAKKSFGRDNRNKKNGIKKCHKMLCLRKKYFEEFAIIKLFFVYLQIEYLREKNINKIYYSINEEDLDMVGKEVRMAL